MQQEEFNIFYSKKDSSIVVLSRNNQWRDQKAQHLQWNNRAKAHAYSTTKQIRQSIIHLHAHVFLSSCNKSLRLENKIQLSPNILTLKLRFKENIKYRI